jgi:Contractile injection system tape measure protein
MASETHIIKKAIVEIHIPKADGAMDIQNKAMAFFKEKICPLIEQIVAKYAHPDETIRIDKLELDLTNFNPESSNEQGLRAMEQQLEEKIIKLIAAEKNKNEGTEKKFSSKKISKEIADEELFIYLLKTGTLPWWVKTEQRITLEALAKKIIQQPSSSFKKELLAAIALPSVRKRIAHQLSVQHIEQLIAIIHSSPAQVLAFIHTLLQESSWTLASTAEKISAILYEYALKYPTNNVNEIRSFLVHFFEDNNDFVFIEKIYEQTNRLATTPLTNTIKEALAITDIHFEGKIKKLFTVKDITDFFETSPKEKVKEKVKDKEKEKQKQKQKEKEKEKQKEKQEEKQKQKLKNETELETTDPLETEETPGDYFIKNAGVVIIAPYLPILFQALDLGDGKKFHSDEAQQRAIYIIHYLITGNDEEIEEHELVFNKVLCGLDPTIPIIGSFSISENEKQECVQLLQAVADNWTALRGVSGEGMRTSFFMRDGILEQQSNGWNLKIEKTTIDILLDKLPWGISILQMPWSEEMIFVEW